METDDVFGENDDALTPEGEEAAHLEADGEGDSPETLEGDQAGDGDRQLDPRQQSAAYYRVKGERDELRDRIAVLETAVASNQRQLPVGTDQEDDQDDDPQPDKEDDPVGYLEWQIRQQGRQLDELKNGYQAEIQQIKSSRHMDEVLSAEQRQIAADGGADKWQARLNFFQQQVASVIPAAMAQVANSADPVAEVVRLTANFGFDPVAVSTAIAADAPAGKRQQQGSRKPVAAAVGNRVQNLSGYSGGRAPGVEEVPDVETMSDADYDAMPAAKRERLLRYQ